MGLYTVLVVDDSAFMRKMISDMINSDGEFTVAATARNGKDALEKLAQDHFDVVTLDIEMPVLNGLDTLQQIMLRDPLPVIMLSSMTAIGAKETILSLEMGAFDFIQKPSGAISLDLHQVRDSLLVKLKLAIENSSRIRAKPDENKFVQQSSICQPTVRTKQTVAQQLVAIGTSTGGPKALSTVLQMLPADFAAPILIVQHMPPKFTRSLAQRLDSLSQIRVIEAKDGMKLMAGTAYIAPGGFHMGVSSVQGGEMMISLSQTEPRGGHRPSVDHLFDSLMPFNKLSLHLVLMTGMGSDGAQGMKSLKRIGAATTIAEAKETCIVYGMPRSAIEAGCIDYILPLQDIAAKIMEVVRFHQN